MEYSLDIHKVHGVHIIHTKGIWSTHYSYICTWSTHYTYVRKVHGVHIIHT